MSSRNPSPGWEVHAAMGVSTRCGRLRMTTAAATRTPPVNVRAASGWASTRAPRSAPQNGSTVLTIAVRTGPSTASPRRKNVKAIDRAQHREHDDHQPHARRLNGESAADRGDDGEDHPRARGRVRRRERRRQVAAEMVDHRDVQRVQQRAGQRQQHARRRDARRAGARQSDHHGDPRQRQHQRDEPPSRQRLLAAQRGEHRHPRRDRCRTGRSSWRPGCSAGRRGSALRSPPGRRRRAPPAAARAAPRAAPPMVRPRRSPAAPRRSGIATRALPTAARPREWPASRGWRSTRSSTR